MASGIMEDSIPQDSEATLVLVGKQLVPPPLTAPHPNFYHLPWHSSPLPKPGPQQPPSLA